MTHEYLTDHEHLTDRDGVKAVSIFYKNHRGEEAWRRITPTAITWEKNAWHDQEQWILHAYDHDKEAMRSFAMKNIVWWKDAWSEK